MRKNISNFQFFSRLKEKGIEAFFVALILHVLVAYAFVGYSNKKLLQALQDPSSVSFNENLLHKRILVRVLNGDLTNISPTPLISTASTVGQGQLKKGSQHVLGNTQYIGQIKNASVSLQRQKVLPAKKSIVGGSKKEEASKGKAKAKQLYTETTKNSAIRQIYKNSLEDSPAILQQQENNQSTTKNVDEAESSYKRFAVETSTSTKQSFWFDENGILQLAANNDEDAAFYLELGEKIAASFVVYLKNHGAVNYYFLKKDFVSMLIKVDESGNIFFIKPLIESHMQSYLNYLPKKVMGEVKTIDARLAKKTLQKHTTKEVYLEVGLFYSGRPLRRWWLGFNLAPQQ